MSEIHISSDNGNAPEKLVDKNILQQVELVKMYSNSTRESNNWNEVTITGQNNNLSENDTV